MPVLEAKTPLAPSIVNVKVGREAIDAVVLLFRDGILFGASLNVTCAQQVVVAVTFVATTVSVDMPTPLKSSL